MTAYLRHRWLAIVTFSMGCASAAPADYFVIRAVDAATGRGVPLVEVETVNHISHVTDSAGIIAFNEPGFMDREVYFHIRSHGYEYVRDALGNRGLKLTPRAGQEAVVKLKRQNIAERFYRITGAGIYRDSVLAGRPVPLREPLLNAQVLGQDTVIVAPYRGKLHWFWGDTDQASYPLGNFAASGATSELPGHGGLPPATGIDLAYFAGPNGFAKAMCPDFGPGLHWIESVFALPDAGGAERLVARVSSQRGLVAPYAWHFAVFNDEKQIFESKVRWTDGDMHDAAHPFRARIDGVDYLYLYPNFRVKADWPSASDPRSYEAFTCVAGDGKVRGARTPIERDDAGGKPRYRWQAGADRLHEGRMRELIETGLLRPEESWLHVIDVETGRSFVSGRGSVFWNEFRRRWIRIMGAAPGEVWFAEAETPTGPWGYARRVVAHDSYNFYNVTQHPFFDEDGGRTIYFEGTYTASFSGAKTKTPRYDYNQIMYRLALDDARLSLPEPVYRVMADGKPRWMARAAMAVAGAPKRIAAVDWYAFATGRAPAGAIAVSQDEAGRLRAGEGIRSPIFFALPAETPAPEGIAGRWRLTAVDNDGAEVTFDVDLAGRDGAVTAQGEQESLSGSGTFAADALTLALRIEERDYDLSAILGAGGLRGDWKRRDGRAAGTWQAERLDSTPAEFRTSAVAPLYEFRREPQGPFVYSMDPDFAAEGFVRAPRPICRVWRSPSTMEMADVGLLGGGH